MPDSPNNSTALRADNLSFAYSDRPIVRDFSLTLVPGDLTVLLGPNGSGKSTILQLLAGRLVPQDGDVLLDGASLRKLSGTQRASKIAVVPQAAPPVFGFTVYERVALGRRARLSPFTKFTEEDEHDIVEAMRIFDVERLAERACNQLSGGELQRVMLAAALAQKPTYLLLDEPTSALDPSHVVNTVNILCSLLDHVAVLLITHDIELAANAAKRLVLLKDGAVIADGPPDITLTPENLTTTYDCKASIKPSVSFF